MCLLLIGNIEENPGPRKRTCKTRQCRYCVRFVSATQDCCSPCVAKLKDGKPSPSSPDLCSSLNLSNAPADSHQLPKQADVKLYSVVEEDLALPLISVELEEENHEAMNETGMDISAVIPKSKSDDFLVSFENHDDRIERQLSVTVNNDSMANVRPLSLPLTDTLRIRSPDVHFYNSVRNLLQLPNGFFRHHLPDEISPSDTPSASHSVARNGNCLFGCFAVLVCGSNCDRIERLFRTLICDNLLTVPFHNEHFEMYGPAGCTSASEYLSRERMRSDGTYGGDLEIVTFCNLFHVNVLVYVHQSFCWVLYSPLLPVTSEHHVLMSLNEQHWEPVLSVLTYAATSVPQANVRTACAPLFSDCRQPQLTDSMPETLKNDSNSYRPRRKKPRLSNVGSYNETSTFPQTPGRIGNFDVDFNKIKEAIIKTRSKSVIPVIDTNIKCDGCLRFSTIFYPIELNKIGIGSVIKRKFLQPMKGDFCDLCLLCSEYSSKEGAHWRNAWPTVICSYLSKRSVKALLPFQILMSWNSDFSYDITETYLNDSVMIDVTRQISAFQSLIGNYNSKDYVSAFKNFNLPTIRCFCGASVFLYECGTVGFNHLLHYLLSDFLSFQSDCKEHLNCMREDFLTICDDDLPFQLRPSIIVNESGLNIATCRGHDTGSKRRMIHVPRHPSCGPLTHPQENRLASIAPALRGASTIKVGEFSATWSIAKTTGGSQGVGSLLLHTKRRLNVKSNDLVPLKENLFTRYRIDMQENLKAIAETEKLSTDNFMSLSSNLLPPDDQVETCLHSSTYVPLNVVIALKTHHDSESSVGKLACEPVMHSCSKSGIRPKLPVAKMARHSYLMSLLYVLFSNNSHLNELAVSRSNKFLETVTDVVLSGKKNVNEAIRLFTPYLQGEGNEMKTLVKLLVMYLDAFDFSQCTEIPHNRSYFLVWQGCRCSNVILNQFYNCASPYFLLQVSSVSDVFNIRLKYEYSCLWWHLDLNKQRATDHQGTFNDKRTRLLILIKPPLAPPSVTTFISGQNEVRCPLHSLLLCADFLASGYICSSAPLCSNKSRWRCPKRQCLISLCKKHLQAANDDGFAYCYERNRDNIRLEGTDEVDEYMSDASHDELNDEFVPPIPTCDVEANFMDTDAAVTSFPLETVPSTHDLDVITVQAVLNSFMTVLERPRAPPHLFARLRRALQCFAATKPMSAVSLLQLEALLFPATFYKQLDDGTFPGALPFFLYCKSSTAKQYGFEDLLQHFSTRLTDLTLPTSSSMQYIQFAVDCLINLALGAAHSSSFFRKGLQSLQIGKDNHKLFSRAPLFQKSDGQIRLRELVAAVSSDPVDCFLTLSCNQKNHPAVGKIIHSIVEKYQNASEEKRNAALNASMTTIIRAWCNSVFYLIELLKNTEENIVGKVRKIWARAEFQTTAGNLPHYHILIWCQPGTFCVDESIQCAKKTIYNKLEQIFESSLGLIYSKKELHEAYDLCIRVHSHDCEKSKFKCLKRKDAAGNKICRTPPFPQSHSNWKMTLIRSYPQSALVLLKDIGLAECDPSNPDWLKPCGVLHSEKHMYAATKGEHLVATSSHIFLLTRSSTNLLATDPQMSCSYLTYYATKLEEHADASITAGYDGKSFRLRSEGVVNRHLSTVKHFLDQDKKRERQFEKVDCTLLPITEGAHWLLRYPIVLTNMSFIHISNVPPGERYVKSCTVSFKMPPINVIRKDNLFLEEWRKPSLSQKVLLQDLLQSNESYDKLAYFNLRPPELRQVRNVSIYFRSFQFEKNIFSFLQMKNMLVFEKIAPWIDCLGNWVRIHPRALSSFENIILQQRKQPVQDYNLKIVHLCMRRSAESWMWLLPHEDSLLPEIVFKNINPRNIITFLVSFLLRFGTFETELDLFHSCELRDSFITAGLVDNQLHFTRKDVLRLLKIYTENELCFLPGGSLTFSAKLLNADVAFSQVLDVDFDESHLETPTVLMSHISEQLTESVLSSFTRYQEALFDTVRSMNIVNLPLEAGRPNLSVEWIPEIEYPCHQTIQSREEQQRVMTSVVNSLRNRMSSPYSLYSSKNEIILGPPGSGKSHLSKIILAYALSNGLVSMVTSLAARRANQLGGEHIHRLFGIPVSNIEVEKIAEEALLKLTHDAKRQHLLRHLQLLIIEEVSVLNAELWTAMDLVLQRLRDTFAPFGGVFVLANGDCMQLPNVSGRDVFSASSLMYGFHFNFLTQLVRMQDEQGKRLLELMEQRPIPEEDIEEIVAIFRNNCHFVDSWDLVDSSIMRVFGKKSAERDAVERHFKTIEQSGISFMPLPSRDEVRVAGSHNWRQASPEVTNFLTRQCREPECLLIYEKAVVRFTRNLNDTLQGALGVLSYAHSNVNSVSVFVAPTPADLTDENIQSGNFMQWRQVSVRKENGFSHVYKGNTVRRHQIPLSNYVATNCHRLMGDELPRLATAVSMTESKYTLWLPSQIFVIGSRVRALACLTFVGKKQETLHAIRSVLRVTNLHEERVYKFFKKLREGFLNGTPVEITSNPFMRTHFNVPQTTGGYVMVLVSLKDDSMKKTITRQTEGSLTSYLRNLNSTAVQDSDLYPLQPWTVAAFVWNFTSDYHRNCIYEAVEQIRLQVTEESVILFCERMKRSIENFDGNLHFCFPGVVRSNEV